VMRKVNRAALRSIFEYMVPLGLTLLLKGIKVRFRVLLYLRPTLQVPGHGMVI
jgi:hypothetical protein